MSPEQMDFKPVPFSPDPDWECEACGAGWAQKAAGRTTVVSGDRLGVWCPLHEQSHLTIDGRNVSLADLGVVPLYSMAGDRATVELVIWDERPQDVRLESMENISIGRRYRYRSARGPIIEIRGKKITLQQVLSSTSPVPMGEGGFSHTIPVQSRYAQLIEKSEWVKNSAVWSIKLKGRPDPIRSEPPTDPVSERDGVVVWPRHAFEFSDRRFSQDVQMVAAFSEISDAIALICEKEAKGGTRVLVPQAFVKAVSPLIAAVEPGAALRYIALAKSETVGSPERGLIPIALPPQPVQVSPAKGLVAIDFGTANTAILYSSGDDKAPTATTDGVLPTEKACFFPCRGAQFDIQLADSLRLFASWYQPASGRINKMSGSLAINFDGGQVAVVPPALIASMRERLGKIDCNLKWQGLETYNNAIVRAYLEHVLLPAFVAIASRGVKTYDAVATYPLAFDRARKIVFTKVLEEALGTLERATGLTRDKLQFLSESRAGVESAMALIADYTLTIDLGGGTTDFALISHHGNEKARILMADSLRLGARDLIRAALPDDARVALGRIAGLDLSELSVRTEVAVEGMLSSNRDQVRLLTAGRSVGKHQRIAALLSGLIVAAVRLVLAAFSKEPEVNSPRKVNVVLLGQGWGLLDGEVLPFDEDQFLSALVSRSNGAFEIQRTATPNDSTERKLQLVAGAWTIARKSSAPEENLAEQQYFGMDLSCKTGGDIQLSDTLVRTAPPEYAGGDPGVQVLLDELVATILSFGGGAVSVGDPALRMAERRQGLSTMDRLVRSAVVDLKSCSNEDEVHRSPLLQIIENTWLEHWVARPKE